MFANQAWLGRSPSLFIIVIVALSQFQFACSLIAADAAEHPGEPNIVLILADDK